MNVDWLEQHNKAMEQGRESYMQAVCVNCMAARKNAGLPHRVKEVLDANWAVLLHAVLHTDMIVLHAAMSVSQ